MRLKNWINNQRKRRLRKQLLKLDKVPALQIEDYVNYILTGDVSNLQKHTRANLLTGLYQMRGHNSAPLTKEKIFVSEFLKLVYSYFPDEPIFKEQETKDLLRDLPNTED